MLASKEMEDTQFPPIEEDVCEAVRYASSWHTTQPEHTLENKIFFILYQMDLHMLINQHPHLSLRLHKQYSPVARFKVDFHRLYIHARREMKKEWHVFPYMAK